MGVGTTKYTKYTNCGRSVSEGVRGFDREDAKKRSSGAYWF